jgi:hypothetical protein
MLKQQPKNSSPLYTSPLVMPGITLMATFDSVKLTDNTPYYSVPPDPIGAARPSSVISVVNTRIQAQSRTGTFLWNADLSDLFASVRESSSSDQFDAIIVYEIHQNRFVIVTLETDFISCSISNMLLAVSTTSNPRSTSDRNFERIDTLIGGNMADYPGLEVDEKAIYLTAVLFSCDTYYFSKSLLVIVDKHDLSSTFYDFPYNDGFTYMPAEVRDSGGAGVGIGTYLVSAGWYDESSIGYLSIVRIRNPLSGASFDQQFVSIGVINDFTQGLPDTPQLGTSNLIATNGRRTYDAVYHDNSLWMATTMLRGGETTAVWAQIYVTNWNSLSLKQFGEMSGEDISHHAYTFFPSVAVNLNGM